MTQKKKFITDRLMKLISLYKTYLYKTSINDNPGNFWLNKNVRKCIDDLENNLLDNWISVSDELPKDNGYYLVNTFDEFEKENFVEKFEYHNKKWYEWDDYNGTDIEKFVTHWQPLPQPPKGK